ncbi:MAG: tRNA lysidine(34) synthetase TilS [Clostridia bacterium]
MNNKSLKEVAIKTSKEFDWPKEGTLILAISGGPDSTLMMILMKEVSEIVGFDLHVVHIDHCLRGKSSLKDSQFVRELSINNNINCTVKRIDIPSIMKKAKGSTQEVCREFRINYIEELAKKMGAFGVAYGHNKNDQVETLLMNLIRGSGMSGLAGMDDYSYKNELLIARPLLKLLREDIIRLLSNNKQNYRVDKSNLKDDYTRNHIRHNLIPFIENNYNANFIDTLSRTNEIISIDNDYLEKTVKNHFENNFNIDTEAFYVNINDINKFHKSIKLRLFRYAYEALVGSLEELTYSHTIEMIKSIDKPHGYTINLPSNISLTRIYDKLYIYKEGYFKTKEINIKEVELNREIIFGKSKLKFYIAENKDNNMKSEKYIFDYDKIDFPIFLRTRKPGDRIKPFNMNGTKKIKDIFIDQKVSPHLRDSIPVIVDCNNKILAVINMKRSNYALVDKNTKTLLVCDFLEVPQWTKI